MNLIPFDPSADFHVHRENLPHWRQRETTYFVTSRLADSLPEKVMEGWRMKRDEWLNRHGLKSPAELTRLEDEKRHEYHREFTARFHELLDAGHGQCVLASSDCADLLFQRLSAGHEKSYWLDAWCIMPNHLHALVQPAKNSDLGEIIRHWKGGSAYDINRLLGQSGALWQKEPFDHIVRSESQLEHFRKYIAENPLKAGLKHGFVVGSGKVIQSFSSPPP
ncbi:transposase [Prosthecobacter algae]